MDEERACKSQNFAQFLSFEQVHLSGALGLWMYATPQLIV